MSFRLTLIAAVLGLTALASNPASADLMIWIGSNGAGGDANCGSATFHNCTDNSIVVGSGVYTSGSNKWTYSLTVTGADSTVFPDVFNINNLVETGTGSLNVFATETDLNYGAAVSLLSTFDTLNATDVHETRYLYLDSTNQGLTTTLLGCVSNAGVLGCNLDSSGTITHILQHLSGLTGDFSLTEEIAVTSTVNKKGFLQSEDEVDVVPEPMSLSLLGMGLVALGAMRRRRKSQST